MNIYIKRNIKNLKTVGERDSQATASMSNAARGRNIQCDQSWHARALQRRRYFHCVNFRQCTEFQDLNTNIYLSAEKKIKKSNKY